MGLRRASDLHPNSLHQKVTVSVASLTRCMARLNPASSSAPTATSARLAPVSGSSYQLTTHMRPAAKSSAKSAMKASRPWAQPMEKEEALMRPRLVKWVRSRGRQREPEVRMLRSTTWKLEKSASGLSGSVLSMTVRSMPVGRRLRTSLENIGPRRSDVVVAPQPRGDPLDQRAELALELVLAAVVDGAADPGVVAVRQLLRGGEEDGVAAVVGDEEGQAEVADGILDEVREDQRGGPQVAVGGRHGREELAQHAAAQVVDDARALLLGPDHVGARPAERLLVLEHKGQRVRLERREDPAALPREPGAPGPGARLRDDKLLGGGVSVSVGVGVGAGAAARPGLVGDAVELEDGGPGRRQAGAGEGGLGVDEPVGVGRDDEVVGVDAVEDELVGDEVDAGLLDGDPRGAGAEDEIGPLVLGQHGHGPLGLAPVVGPLPRVRVVEVEEHDGRVAADEGVALRDQREVLHRELLLLLLPPPLLLGVVAVEPARARGRVVGHRVEGGVLVEVLGVARDVGAEAGARVDAAEDLGDALLGVPGGSAAVEVGEGGVEGDCG
ncbi:hypothetical protein CTA1_6319 [Colletotrichum tanaceti]|uniref:Uncharacterized protein n=1 Tax=Colletotrichum tanaceti TaxID=1306861 RepID=A0A4U6X5U2_9PEZI|nr:hypothetical protein CTA1_6319 [Colletotrichum tanaceti]